MSVCVYLVSYLAIVVFIVGVMKRTIHYLTNPLHVRWELYPVAHEGKRASYGGSYLEEVDWWQKERKVSRIGELKVMIPEIFLLKAVWENNRPLWFLTYPFHLGLYLTVGFLGLIVIGAIAQLSGSPVGSGASLLNVVGALTAFVGPLGFILTILGAVGLIIKRRIDPGMRNYSSFSHFFNLILFAVTMAVALIVCLSVDPTFSMARTFVANLISFNMTPVPSSPFLLQVLLGVVTIAYIPLTHMSHFFMKYFLYHDIRWGDEPNVGTPKTDAKIGVVLNYPVSWAASHIAGHGKETWAEVATFNPVAKPEGAKE